jgi:hypothetical protein
VRRGPNRRKKGARREVIINTLVVCERRERREELDHPLTEDARVLTTLICISHGVMVMIYGFLVKLLAAMCAKLEVGGCTISVDDYMAKKWSSGHEQSSLSALADGIDRRG